MIIKQLDQPINTDKFAVAGYEAEKQMAYYLKHGYSDSENVFVYNNIRFKELDDYTQVDHLIFHEYGMIIVESKSVSTKIKFNERREWNRWWNNSWEGMQNPVAQAKRQANSLRKVLNKNREKLFKKIFGKTLATFDKMLIDCVVAISDQCAEIKRPEKNDYPNVIKADLVTDYIDKIISQYRKEDSALTLSLKIPWAISKESRIRIKDFLLEIHEPITINQDVSKTAKSSNINTTPSPIREEKIQTYNKCPYCKHKITIRNGYNYYWHCESCNKNIPIKYNCPGCGQRLKIRKKKHEYFICCDQCQIKELYYTSKI